ncbi:MAG: hypothetical protein IAE94_06085 [Chthoniobacterales bacterium]|nr:hypothetical protein [Chthoniobacterales bacterium]
MSFADLTSQTLRGLLSLTEKREKLLEELKKLEDEILHAYSAEVPQSKPLKVKHGRRIPTRRGIVEAKTPGKKGKRETLKESILAALKTAGSEGMAVKDLSAKLGVKNKNVHVWFSSTGKAMKELKKVGTGRWALQA